MINILFVCTSNICRSPLAQGLCEREITRLGLDAHFSVDSAGVQAFHASRAPDPRTVAIAKQHNLDISAQRARCIDIGDFYHFHYLVAMTQAQRDLLSVEKPKDATGVISLFSDNLDTPLGEDVPDPYVLGPEGFDAVYSLIDQGVGVFVQRLAWRHHLQTGVDSDSE